MLRSTLENAEKFAEAALHHSQCPTAMSGGKLGVVKRQQLYPELEEAAFGLLEVEASIIERLTDERHKEAQKSWVKSLFGKRSESDAKTAGQ